MAKGREIEGHVVKGDRVKVMGATGIGYDAGPDGEQAIPPDGTWVEIVIRGRSGDLGLDFQKNGVVREVEVHASTAHCTVALMDSPPPEPVPEGQEVLPVDGSPDEGTEPEAGLE